MTNPGSESETTRSEIKILAVDDREDNLLSIETILEKDGYTIVKAQSGRAALKLLLKEHDFSLILMDVQMPEMNGLETATLIYEREKLRHIPVIFITAHEYGEDLMFRGYRMGAVDYIYKPYNPDLLRFKVGVFVELYRKNRELRQQEKTLKAINQSLEKEIEEKRASENRVQLLNRQLVQNNSELKMINEELDRFAYVASHDLQEPLRKILLFIDKLDGSFDAQLDPVVRDHFQKISRAAERMQSLITDLLKYSRHAQNTEDFTLTDLNQVLADVLADMEPDIRKKNAVIVSRELPVVVAIPSQIRQLMQNLLSNAIKFSKPDFTPQVEIFSDMLAPEKKSAGEEFSRGNFHQIHIKDNGIGFDPKYAQDIFAVFKRLHSYHEIEGTGIGLSICKKIVEQHSGTITAQGMPGEGALFTVGLPAKRR